MSSVTASASSLLLLVPFPTLFLRHLSSPPCWWLVSLCRVNGCYLPFPSRSPPSGATLSLVDPPATPLSSPPFASRPFHPPESAAAKPRLHFIHAPASALATPVFPTDVSSPAFLAVVRTAPRLPDAVSSVEVPHHRSELLCETTALG